MNKSPKDQSRPESQLILVLDDELTVTEGLAAGLEREDRTIITCNDVESAQLMVERFHPSHIVADIRISGPFAYEGLDFIRYAKRHAPESRVILMTGDAPEALQLEAAERGAVAFLQKPFEIQELDSILDLIASSAVSWGANEQRMVRVPVLDEIIASDALNPFFQPVVSLEGKCPHIGYESLARYRGPTPLRDPELLFKYAARKQRLADLEIACAERTFHAGAKLAAAGLLFLNVHPEVFTSGPRFRDMLAARSRHRGIPLNRVVLEITEQGSLSDEVVVLKTIADLQEMGVQFAFDDLGIAYSHLALVDKIRPKYLKVSQHFGAGFETDSTKMKIVMNLLSLARDFNAELILEGIEEESTAEAAKDLRIPLGQGFFFGLPADASTFRAATD